ncbi:MAG: metal-sensitive transcriptional regulator [Aphanocapsa lilacina HA4352-LM1]|jgi:DNA-binding FrmR family transcriptional regulator|nr:metal-sensitive transcriptional regulator [Aphanocapsa lilacina HA4352-LM1]
MPHKYTQDVLKHLASIEGRVRDVYTMVEAGGACPDVLVRMVYLRSAVNAAAQLVLKDHTEHCLVEAAGSERYEEELENFLAAVDMLL